MGNHIEFKVLKHSVAGKVAVTKKRKKKVEKDFSLCSEEDLLRPTGLSVQLPSISQVGIYTRWKRTDYRNYTRSFCMIEEGMILFP